MKKIFSHIKVIVVCMTISFCYTGMVVAQSNGKIIVVDGNGGADFKSIQAAINSLPVKANAQRIIYIRNGVYREKIFIEKNFVTLFGEDKNKTHLVISLARDIWHDGSKLKDSKTVLQNCVFRG